MSVSSRGLRRLRRASGWSQEDLADRSGVRQNTISRIETAGCRTPRPSTLRKLATALSCPVAALSEDPQGGPQEDPHAAKAEKVKKSLARELVAVLCAEKESIQRAPVRHECQREHFLYGQGVGRAARIIEERLLS